MIALGFCGGSFGGLRHALAFAADLHRMCIVNQEPAYAAARKLDLDEEQTAGVVRLLRVHPTLSPERAALAVMLDPGLDDEDIAEIFGRSVRWARVVREQAEEIRAEEPIEPHLEYVESGLQPGDPMPDEIYAIAAELRGKRLRQPAAPEPFAVPVFEWSGHAFLSVGPG